MRRVGLALLVSGGITTGIGGRVFLDKSNELMERNESAQVSVYDNIHDQKDVDFIGRQIRDDRILSYSASAIVSGLVILSAGYILMRVNPHERFFLGQKKYGKSFSNYHIPKSKKC